MSQDTAGQNDSENPTCLGDPLTSRKGNDTLENRQKRADLAKIGVRNRRRLRMQVSYHLSLLLFLMLFGAMTFCATEASIKF